jgi:hypothetical protein
MKNGWFLRNSRFCVQSRRTKKGFNAIEIVYNQDMHFL